MDLILYHGSCPDGWCSAFIASKRYPEARLIAMDHGADHTEVLKECVKRDVLMVDFSLRTREENDELAASTRSFQIYDHHKTAQAVLEGAPYAVFDMKRSGAGLSWDYLFGKDSDAWSQPVPFSGIERPWFVNYVENRDLWNWKLPNSREVCAYLGTLEFTKEAWDELDAMDENAAAFKGEGSLAQINHYVREAIKQAQTGMLQGYRTAILNVPYLNCSEIGNELAKTHQVSLTYFENASGMYQFSLRSVGEIDVSEIAKTFGGGGHKNASGFQLSLEKGRETVDLILGRIILPQYRPDFRSPGGCV